MVCQTYALLAVSRNSRGTASRAARASRSAARRISSSRPSVTWLASRGRDAGSSEVRVGEPREIGRAAQPLKAACPLRSDATRGNAHDDADLRVRQRRVGEEQRQQLPATGGQFSEGSAKQRVPFG